MSQPAVTNDERTALACLGGLSTPRDSLLLRRLTEALGAAQTLNAILTETPPSPAELATTMLSAETAPAAPATEETTNAFTQAADSSHPGSHAHRGRRTGSRGEGRPVTDQRQPTTSDTGQETIEDLVNRIRWAFMQWRTDAAAAVRNLPELAAACDRTGARFIIPGDPEWPTSQLNDLGPTRPYGLWLRGQRNLRDACSHAVTLAGSRAASDYGLHVATQLAEDLAEAGWTTLSGGAYGIDARAHQGALAQHGTTVAVLPCGVDVAYPAAHARMFTEISANGVLVSEWPPGTRPQLRRFLARNRIAAALSRATVIIESSTHSGSLNTARHARDLGRPLMAVPGPITSATSRGCHLLIREQNATLVTTADEITQHLHTT